MKLMSEIVDFNSPIPKYLQISNWLEEMIRKGRYGVGERLPSESSLAEICGECYNLRTVLVLKPF